MWARCFLFNLLLFPNRALRCGPSIYNSQYQREFTPVTSESPIVRRSSIRWNVKVVRRTDPSIKVNIINNQSQISEWKKITFKYVCTYPGPPKSSAIQRNYTYCVWHFSNTFQLCPNCTYIGDNTILMVHTIRNRFMRTNRPSNTR